jgi:hypothetical protein
MQLRREKKMREDIYRWDISLFKKINKATKELYRASA